MNRSRTQSLALIGLCVALLAVGAFISIPFGPVPFTLQTAVYVLILMILEPREATAAVVLYIIIGAIGIPVFSSMRGGLGIILGPTGGFLIAAPIAMALCSFLLSAMRKGHFNNLVAEIIAVALFELILYVVGVPWLMFVANMNFPAAMAAGCLPFIVPDVAKAAIALVVARGIKKALR